ncbi:MAG: hypothetical protein K9M08_12285 [Pirellula sp.]|nr:hypothetical protein [Pirellula sp.]
MAVSIPWHSSSNWQPTEVTQFINHVNSGAGTLIVRTDAGLAYLKALGNPDGPHALAKDLLGTHLAAMLGLPTFDYAVIEITELDELQFFKGGNAEPGPAFVTRGEEGSVWGNDKRLLEKIDNPDAISGLVVVDTWLRNTDRHYLPKGRVNWDNVFFSKESSEGGKLSLRVMDFSHAIQYGGELTSGVRSIANIRDEDVFGLFPEFRKKLSRDAIRHYASILGGVSRSQIEDAVGLVPHQWHLGAPVRLALVSYLLQRASFVAETIESRLFDPPQLTIDLSDGGES